MQQELETLQQLTTLAVEFLVKYSFQIIGAFIILRVEIKLAGLDGLSQDFAKNTRLISPSVGSWAMLSKF